MKVLIKNARIIDPTSSYNNSIQDIFIEAGIIRQIGSNIEAGDCTVVREDGLHVSPGWVDVFANFCDPGYEFKESLQTGAQAAAAGGFTDVFVIPNTKPVVDTKSQVEYVRSAGNQAAASVHPLGAISKNTEGKDLAEMYDMRNSGAIAFTDGINPIQSAGILLKALQYVKAFNGVVIQLPDDKSVGANGLMHEGIVSTRLGLAGKPMMAEELLVARDIKLARYTESKLHFTGITSPRSLEYIRRAKEAGLQVSCSVAPFHLFFTDDELRSYDTNLKVYPPLRTKVEQEALKAAVMDGTIDCVASHHMPQEYDSKVVEFEYAKNGMIGLETCFGCLTSAIPELSMEKCVDLLSTNPRRIFSLPKVAVAEKQQAQLTMFIPDRPVEIDNDYFYSRSRNSAFIGRTLAGGAIGTVNGDRLFIRK
jgi:dihydroorotase